MDCAICRKRAKGAPARSVPTRRGVPHPSAPKVGDAPVRLSAALARFLQVEPFNVMLRTGVA